MAHIIAQNMPKMTEAELQQTIINLARDHGWLVAHFRPGMMRSGRWATPVQADGAGFVDLVLIRERALFRELKAEKGKLSPRQQVWIARLLQAGLDADVWRPKDWASGLIIQELTRGAMSSLKRRKEACHD